MFPNRHQMSSGPTPAIATLVANPACADIQRMTVKGELKRRTSGYAGWALRQPASFLHNAISAAA